MLSANEVIDAIHGAYYTGSKNGLNNTRLLLERICPQLTVPVVHIAGTNGKGSTCAMLESVLRHAGLRTGLYTSPFLQSYQERIRLDGEPLADDLLEKYGNPLVAAAEAMDAQGDHPTPFELGTGLALSVFQGEQVDIAVVEVGLGGRLDPTNVLIPRVCGIAAIGLDHMHILGDTLEAIAGEKAGIMKPGVPVVCHPATEGVAAVFAAQAAALGAPLRQLTDDMLCSADCGAHGSTATYQLENTWEELRLSLPGAHQLTNAMTVLGIVEELRKQGFDIPENAVREGLAATVWPARLEWAGNVLIDGAHNAQGIAALRAFVEAHLMDKRRVLLTGVLSEKLQPEMLANVCALADTAFTVTPDNHRAMTAAEYAQHLAEGGITATACDTLEDALEKARAAAGEDGVVIAAGSLYFAGMLRTALGLKWR